MICVYCQCEQYTHMLKIVSDKQYVCVCTDCFSNILDNKICCSKCGNEITYNSNSKSIILENAKVNKNGIICSNCLQTAQTEQSTDSNRPMFTYKSNNYKDYFFKPTPACRKLKSQDKNNIYLGVQLQIGGGASSEIVNRFCNSHAGNIFYFKRDGSIELYGCEIVTHPCTLQYHMNENSGWKQIFNDFVQHGFSSGESTNTGLHIHVNRSILNNDQIKKIDLFVNYYKDFFEKLARRNQSHYAQYNLKTLRQWGHTTTSRYSSVNFENQHTIQFRIFNGTNKIQQLYSSLQLVHATILFLNHISYQDLYQEKQNTLKRFKEFIFNGEHYKDLKKIIKDLNI